MQSSIRWWMILAAAVLAACCFGCRQEDDGDEDGASARVQTPDDQNGPEIVKEPTEVIVPKEKIPSEIPEVQMPEALRKTCLAYVGDTFPEAELPGPDGAPQSLKGLMGERLTVVLFWAAGSIRTRLIAGRALGDLQKDVVEPYSEKGVGVVSVNEGDSGEVVAEQTVAAGVTFPVLLDADGALFDQVATEKQIRIYVLDSEGKILWLDAGYDEVATKEKLIQTIRAVLRE